MRAAVACALVATSVLGCPSGNSRDFVPETRDVRLGPDAGPPLPNTSLAGYEYVAQRPHASVGLVGSRNMKADEAERATERIADELEACAIRVEKRGELVAGAAQLVALGGEHGTAEITDMRLAPGGPVAANALECIVAPLRASPLSPSFTLAIEATWGPAGAPK